MAAGAAVPSLIRTFKKHIKDLDEFDFTCEQRKSGFWAGIRLHNKVKAIQKVRQLWIGDLDNDEDEEDDDESGYER
ncbi:hypothetical protein GNI_098960 [Gregarina niphandrodes]|uniref:Uncharacterized protein n=1 Tax=Gregarina niphandrodes TaxID=110365 RepID=A0A023B4S2_GRENI|nr:hypothetical protein GNI_098960 [Gregarina niphandrodes]EZG57181.1 hypothetical protein GNI_098960 [Gregarina niphandrodes]|eukprot:XP_011131086.1 hypothetical protein GNI_098960 [Gregarina niphandrodes]